MSLDLKQFHDVSSIQSANFQMRKDVHRKIVGPIDAWIRLEATVVVVDVAADSSPEIGSTIQPKDRWTASFQRSNLTSRSSEVSRGWNLSIEEVSWPESGRVSQTSIPSACPAKKEKQ
jgi:hypothetical protein